VRGVGAGGLKVERDGFGDFNRTQWLRFTVIHDNHHQKIIRDVLAARSDRSTATAAE